MNDDPNQTADHLIDDHGVDGALVTVRREIAAAHSNGDYYRLSVWRDVRRILQNKQDAAGNQETPAV